MPLRLVLLATLLFILTSTAFSQAPCTLKLADLPPSPELRGFHLGMTREQVTARVPQAVLPRADYICVPKTTINPSFDPKIDQTAFADVRSISLDFLDEQLTSLWFGYEATFKWKTVDEFVAGISDALKLPKTWQSWRGRGQQLRCADFTVIVSTVAQAPSFRILDEAAENRIAERREAREAQESAAAVDEDGEHVIADVQTKLYYTSECSPSKPIESKNQVTFKSAVEAEKAGYKKSKTCQ